LPFVEFAYEESPLTPAVVNPSDDPLALLQGYLLPAPAGIGATFAWSLPGADGANVRFVDIERGWQLDHEDLAGAGVVALNQSVPGNEFHSTACLGIVLAQDNTRGVIGVAPKVKGAIASSLRPALPDAFLQAVGFLQAGDVLLIEEQTADLRPVEMDPHTALLIRTLMLLGIVVIEPAGNGGHDLNLALRADGTSLDRTTPIFFDSGAIVVGARQALSRSRWPSSCFGNRVDCHAWGELIVTTSSIVGPFGPYMGLNPAAGDVGFGGTSGASAIIAGAAIVLQGVARARGTPLTPTRMRELLSGPFNTSSTDPIGVMPDLEQAANHI
jgi:microbial collagenase